MNVYVFLLFFSVKSNFYYMCASIFFPYKNYPFFLFFFCFSVFFFQVFFSTIVLS
ncbi:hypothetical protein BDF20DRAFT_864012 [Mycotypha africana]|uniref:uncharacterized protein n=1 Tax=Mycotypha africana TaxID=64632 RepID=UPI0023011B2E|nr:uncharacterized protein BDF20DRAFT_864012 [Mycotypha africana]KAI8981923.1 hypothetical protein BDF20DRAFT_864012 [Mycotypha africana]